MPIAAFGAALITSYLMGFFQYLGLKMYGGFQEDGLMLLYIAPMLSCAAFGYVFAYIAYKVSPKAKLRTGITMSVVLLAAWGVLVVFGWNSPSFKTSQALTETFRLIGILIGTAMALVDKCDAIKMQQ